MSRIKNSIDKLISVLIFTLNEERNIEECINSVKWIKNIVIIDTGSKDRTLEIVREYTNNIYITSSLGFVESARNFGIKKINTEWILMIDADERLSDNARYEIQKLVNSQKYDGFWIPRRNYVSNKYYLKYGYFYPDWQLRLFKKKNYRFSGVIHQPINIPKKKLCFSNNIYLTHNLTHAKYNTYFSFFRLTKYIFIEAKEYKKINKVKFLDVIAFFRSCINILRYVYRSFIKLNGYKDGYYGLRAAIIFGVYKGFVEIISCFLRR